MANSHDKLWKHFVILFCQPALNYMYFKRKVLAISSWVSLCKYAVNLSGGQPQVNCIDVYAVLERANDRKLHVFGTKHEANTYSEHLIHSHDFNVSI